jgi:hypothetical protein
MGDNTQIKTHEKRKREVEQISLFQRIVTFADKHPVATGLFTIAVAAGLVTAYFLSIPVLIAGALGIAAFGLYLALDAIGTALFSSTKPVVANCEIAAAGNDKPTKAAIVADAVVDTRSDEQKLYDTLQAKVDELQELRANKLVSTLELESANATLLSLIKLVSVSEPQNNAAGNQKGTLLTVAAELQRNTEKLVEIRKCFEEDAMLASALDDLNEAGIAGELPELDDGDDIDQHPDILDSALKDLEAVEEKRDDEAVTRTNSTSSTSSVVSFGGYKPAISKSQSAAHLTILAEDGPSPTATVPTDSDDEGKKTPDSPRSRAVSVT